MRSASTVYCDCHEHHPTLEPTQGPTEEDGWGDDETVGNERGSETTTDVDNKEEGSNDNGEDATDYDGMTDREETVTRCHKEWNSNKCVEVCRETTHYYKGPNMVGKTKGPMTKKTCEPGGGNQGQDGQGNQGHGHGHGHN